MWAIYKRELKAYSNTFLGALFIGAMLLLLGIYFSVYNLFMGYPYIGYALSSVVVLFLLSIPILTMRILAEERRQKTDQLILTAPIGVGSIVAGKFFALATIFAVPTLIISLYPLILSAFGTVPLGESYLAILGFFLYGISCIGIGIFVSSLTESQVIAAVAAFGILFLGYVMSGLCNMISATGNILTKILGGFDMVGRFDAFLNGSLQLSGIVYFLSVTALFLIFTVQSIQKRRYQMSVGNFGMGAYNSVIIIVGTAVVVLLNMLASEVPSKYTSFDVTANKLYTLTDETKALVSSLEEDINIYVLDNEEQADSTLDTTLKSYGDISSYIKVSYVDPAVNPKFYTQYTDALLSSGSVIVESGKRSKVIDYWDIYETEMDYYTYSSTVTGYDGEGQITSAIAYVTANDMPKIYFLEGHGELSFEAKFLSALEKENVDFETINLMNYDAVPEDAQCVAIFAPVEDFSTDDTEKMMSYMEKGGDVLLITGFTDRKMDNFNKLLDFYGVKATEGLVIEADAGSYYQIPYSLLPQINYDPITEGVLNGGSYVFVPYAQGLIVEEREDVAYSELLVTSDKSYARNEADAVNNDYSRQEGDLDGPFAVGVKCEKAAGEESSVAVIYSSEYLFSESVDEIVAGTNLRLFTGTMGSFINHTVSISIPVKSYEITYLAMPQNVMMILAFISVIVIPFAFLIGGFVIWFRRRRW